MKTNRLIAVACVVGISAASTSFGWGEDGHRITGDIAEHYLSPAAKAAVEALLNGQTLADVSTWADEIKSDRSYDWARPLHYANVKPGADEFELDRDCPERGCVISAIAKYTRILRDRDASAADRTEALKFLVHFVCDVHQPLHVSRAKDRGGNDLSVEFFHNRTNLHRVWDSGLIRHTGKPWRVYAQALAATIDSTDVAAWGGETDPSDWATESYRLALSDAYQIPGDGVIGADYAKRCVPIVEKRLKVAGVRLAVLLNAIFADSVPDAD